MLKKLYRLSPSKMKKLMCFVHGKCFDFLGTLLQGEIIKKLREESSECKTIDDYIDLAFSFEFNPINFISFDIKPSQIRWEISQLLKILAEPTPKTVLEIGTFNGGTLFLFSRIASKDATLISIDLPGGKFGGGYPKWRMSIYESFASSSQKIHLIRGNSHSEETLREVKDILGSRKIDFLFIDGGHTYNGVKKDFEIYSKLVGRGRVIAFHDIVYHPHEPECQVDKFWGEQEEMGKYLTEKIISNPKQTWAGIGVLYV